MKFKDIVKASQNASTGGRKFDGGKLQYGLIPPLALKEGHGKKVNRLILNLVFTTWHTQCVAYIFYMNMM